MLAGVSGELQVLLPLECLVDLTPCAAAWRRTSPRPRRRSRGLAGRLANPSFAGKAPPEVVAECKVNLAEAEAQAALARRRLVDLV